MIRIIEGGINNPKVPEPAKLPNKIFSGYAAFYFTKMLTISFVFKERSEGADEILIWIPQTPLALGSILLFVCVFHHLLKYFYNND